MQPFRFRIQNDVFETSLTKMYPYTSWHEFHTYFSSPAGKEHYKLIGYLASQCPDDDVVYDIGTYVGMSAMAMSIKPTINVVTYDIQDHFPNDASRYHVQSIKNIEFRMRDCVYDMQEIANAKLVLLDIEPHDGIQENRIINEMVKAGFKGICVCDDIHVNDGMKQWWQSLSLKKYDVSKYGHWSGTGIIVFDDKVVDVDIA